MMVQKKIDKEMENLLKKLLKGEEYEFLKKVIENQGVLEENK
ncbi:MAG: hypothetical protein WA102_07405 [Candidatus Methanoperedens sp.]